MNLDQLLADCVQFTQRLIQTPSMTHEEQAIAELIAGELRQLGFDEVWLDALHNVYGRVYGQDRGLPALVLNAHTDHVDPGEAALWPVPPFSGEIVAGRIHGRGACDIKGPLAVQVYSLAGLLRNGERPRRDVVFCGVVEEEIGGRGARYWVENLDYPVELCLLAEPSDNQVALGHRGIWGVWVKFHGRSVHASAPERGENPNYYLATFLSRLPQKMAELPEHPYLGATTVSPTIIEVDTVSSNVTPAWVRLFLDFRTAVESPASLTQLIAEVAEGLPYSLEKGHPGVTEFDVTEPLHGYATDPEDEATVRVAAAIERGTGQPVKLTSYRFATDGRFFPEYGIKVLGYSAGEEPLAHTVRESISIEKMRESLLGYMQILREF
jgi:succinyl-diaminopimelate desuccinylase